MSNLIDSLVNVEISISGGSVSEDSFNNLLLIDYENENTSVDTSPLTVVSCESLDEVIYKGWPEETNTYKAAKIALDNGANKVYIISADRDEDAGDTVDGDEPSETGITHPEITDVLNAAASASGWYGFTVVPCGEFGTGADDYTQAAKWAEENNKMFGLTIDCADGIDAVIKNDDEGDDLSNVIKGGYSYTMAFGSNSIAKNQDNEFMALAVMAKVMTYQPGSETWAYKTVSGITAEEWDDIEITALKNWNINYYMTCANYDITLNGKVLSGEWIDAIRFRDWLKNDMQERIFRLFVKNPKVPYTDAGVALIQNQMIASLKEGQHVGGIAETEYDEDGNEIAGYSTSVPLVASIPQADRLNRVLTGCTFTARLAGAIHMVEIKGTLTE